MALADVVQETQEPVNEIFGDEARGRLDERLLVLQEKVCHQLNDQGISEDDMIYQRYLNMRYQGTETAIMVLEPLNRDFKEEFKRMHLLEFAFLFPDDRPIIVDDVRVRGIGSSGGAEKSDGRRVEEEMEASSFNAATWHSAEQMV